MQLGPTAASPGPTFEMHAMEAVRLVGRSFPSSVRTRTPAAVIRRYSRENTCTPCTTWSLTALPSNQTRFTREGRISRFSSAWQDFSRMMIRETFIPPPVEPAHPPMNISSTRIQRESSGHRSKSQVENPVVLRMVMTWKKAYRRPFAKPPQSFMMFTEMTRTVPAMIPR